jgi:hypothetical protein
MLASHLAVERRSKPALAGYQGEHTPFDAVDDGFDYFSSAFL